MQLQLLPILVMQTTVCLALYHLVKITQESDADNCLWHRHLQILIQLVRMFCQGSLLTEQCILLVCFFVCILMVTGERINILVVETPEGRGA